MQHKLKVIFTKHAKDEPADTITFRYSSGRSIFSILTTHNIDLYMVDRVELDDKVFMVTGGDALIEVPERENR